MIRGPATYFLLVPLWFAGTYSLITNNNNSRRNLEPAKGCALQNLVDLTVGGAKLLEELYPYLAKPQE